MLFDLANAGLALCSMLRCLMDALFLFLGELFGNE